MYYHNAYNDRGDDYVREQSGEKICQQVTRVVKRKLRAVKRAQSQYFQTKHSSHNFERACALSEN